MRDLSWGGMQEAGATVKEAKSGCRESVSPDVEVQRSRRRLREALSSASDLTFIRGWGNLGDELIYAGTRRLLEDVAMREIGLEELDRCRGDTALLAGGGAWCQSYHELMPHLLPMVEDRFAQVIISPSSFDLRVPEVRKALSRSRALVFARELESWRQLREVCRVEVAHDCAFFFDFSPYRRPGKGVLHAYRTDTESAAGAPLPEGNIDLSLSCASLEEWLERIARHAIIRTDRAHVMIAAALLGKRVEYRASNYHKLPAIAEYALQGYPVFRHEPTGRVGNRAASQGGRTDGVSERTGRGDAPVACHRDGRQESARLPAGSCEAEGPRVVVALVSRELSGVDAMERSYSHPRPLRPAVDTLHRGGTPAPCDQHRSARHPVSSVEVVKVEPGLSPGQSRQRVVDQTNAEYVFFVGEGITVEPGTLERLVHVLEDRPWVAAAAAHIVDREGRGQWCGGGYRANHGLLWTTEREGCKRVSGHDTVKVSRLVHLRCTLVRHAVLCRAPLDAELAIDDLELEWCLRLEQADSRPAFVIVEDAVGVRSTNGQGARVTRSPTGRREQAMEVARSIARLYDLCGLVHVRLFDWIPELRSPESTPDLVTARLFLTLINTRGSGWVLVKWQAGELDPLVRWSAQHAEEVATWRRRHDQVAERLGEIESSKWWQLAGLYWTFRRRLVSVLVGLLGRRR